MKYLIVFAAGGLICSIGQLLISKTSLTPARILVVYVVTGVILTVVGVYEPFIKLANCGASIPLTGFGYSLAKGAIDGAKESGFLGALSGGLKNTAAGISAAIVFGYLNALLFKSRSR